MALLEPRPPAPRPRPRPATLRRLLAPRSVAVVGASTSPAKAGYQAVVALQSFEGEVFPVNPHAPEILGRKAYPSLAAIGKPVDLVLFAVPAPACPDAVREAVRLGCGAGLVMSGGFSESGDEGAALQRDLADACRGSAFRLLGPNTAGFYDRHASLNASFVPDTEQLPRGRVAVVAQSGGINLVVSFLVARLGYGLSYGIGLGNSLDVDAAEALEFLAHDPRTGAIALHLEGIPEGRRLVEALRRVTPRKPVAVLPVGRADVGAFARSHTGNLIGPHAVKVAALRQAGAVVAESTEELAAAAALLSTSRLPPSPRPGFGVLTGQGGAGLVILDRLRASGASVPPLRPETRARVRELLPLMTYLENPVDTSRPGPSFQAVLAAIAEDEGVDAVLAFALHEPAAVRPELALPPVARSAGKPIVFGTAGPEAGYRPVVEALRAHGIYSAESPDALARAALVLAEDAVAQWRLARETRSKTASTATATPAATSTATAMDASSSAPRGGGAVRGAAHGPLDEHAAKLLLEEAGVPAPRRVACATREEARAAFRTLAKPVVAKVLAAEIAHKTEAGGVHLGVADEAALERALDAIDGIPLAGRRRYLLEETAPEGIELIVGAVRDPSFGPTVTVGLGGVLAEALRDTSTRLAPVSPEAVREMLEELRGAPLLRGWRGAPAADLDAIAAAVAGIAALLSRHPGLHEIEVNPLRATAAGVVALDALAR